MIHLAKRCPACVDGAISADTGRCDHCGFSTRVSPRVSYDRAAPPVPTSTAPSSAPPPAAPAEPTPPVRAWRSDPPRLLVPRSRRPFPTTSITFGAVAVLVVAATFGRAIITRPAPPPELRRVYKPVSQPISDVRERVTPLAQDDAPASRPDSLPVPTESTSVSPVSSPVRPVERPDAPTTTPQPGRLFVSATPWGQLFIDGVPAGNTPRPDVPIAPGRHFIRVVRYGFEPFEREITVAPGDTIRLTNIVLQVRP